MQGAESQIQDEGDVVLWRNALPTREGKTRPFVFKMIESLWFKIFMNVALLGVFGFWTWDMIQNPPVDFGLLAICFMAATVGTILGNSLKIPFLYRTPKAAAIPSHLSRESLSLSESEDKAVAVDAIKAIRRTYHEGSPAILISLPKYSLTLITSDRDALLRALLTLRPDLETTP